jgi:hypothetical protein
MTRGKARSYLADGRLSDVLALIQVLALDPSAHRSESGLRSELQGQPRSADTWGELAKDHQEFFRVSADGEHHVSLVARHVTARDALGERGPLQADYASELLRLAVDMHDREVRRSQRWHSWDSILSSIIAGVFLLIGVLLGTLLH